MSNEPKRPWFRLHLSSLLLGIIAIGGLLWLNFKYHDIIQFNDDKTETTSIGWPMQAIITRTDYSILVGDVESHWKSLYKSTEHFFPDVFWLWFLPDLLANGSIMLAAVAIPEILIRNRERLKPSCWFRFHLSTALALMLVSGPYLWVNVKFSAFQVETSYYDTPRPNYDIGHGWPLMAVRYKGEFTPENWIREAYAYSPDETFAKFKGAMLTRLNENCSSEPKMRVLDLRTLGIAVVHTSEYEFLIYNFLVDAGTFIVILFAAFLFSKWIGRRFGRSPNPQ